MGVERCAAPVVVGRRPGVGVGRGALEVTERRTGVEAEGDEGVAEPWGLRGSAISISWPNRRMTRATPWRERGSRARRRVVADLPRGAGHEEPVRLVVCLPFLEGAVEGVARPWRHRLDRRDVPFAVDGDGAVAAFAPDVADAQCGGLGGAEPV